MEPPCSQGADIADASIQHHLLELFHRPGVDDDVVLLLVGIALLSAIGLLGLGLRGGGFPLAPVIIGLLLGPMAEQQLARALAIGEGDVTTLLVRPVPAVLLAVAALILARPALATLARLGRKASGRNGGSPASPQ
jgi:TctA family transporter